MYDESLFSFLFYAFYLSGPLYPSTGAALVSYCYCRSQEDRLSALLRAAEQGVGMCVCSHGRGCKRVYFPMHVLYSVNIRQLHGRL